MCEQNDEFITEENVVYLTTNNKNSTIVWSFLGAFLATNNEYCGLDMLTLSIPLDFGQFTVDLSENKYSEKAKKIIDFFSFYILHLAYSFVIFLRKLIIFLMHSGRFFLCKAMVPKK